MPFKATESFVFQATFHKLARESVFTVGQLFTSQHAPVSEFLQDGKIKTANKRIVNVVRNKFFIA